MNGETETTMNENSKSVHWATDGPLSGRPGEIMRLLATEDGKTFGYGYGDGWSMIFGSEHGDVSVLPGQWVTRYSDGTITVTDEKPDPRAVSGRGLRENNDE